MQGSMAPCTLDRGRGTAGSPLLQPPLVQPQLQGMPDAPCSCLAQGLTGAPWAVQRVLTPLRFWSRRSVSPGHACLWTVHAYICLCACKRTKDEYGLHMFCVRPMAWHTHTHLHVLLVRCRRPSWSSGSAEGSSGRPWGAASVRCALRCAAWPSLARTRWWLWPLWQARIPARCLWRGGAGRDACVYACKCDSLYTCACVRERVCLCLWVWVCGGVCVGVGAQAAHPSIAEARCINQVCQRHVCLLRHTWNS